VRTIERGELLASPLSHAEGIFELKLSRAQSETFSTMNLMKDTLNLGWVEAAQYFDSADSTRRGKRMAMH
jgi:hypothetical protein